ncbi:GIN domain-containing protein [Hyphococcus sp.]|uniref:GIN domain-containing protein n=1 Tax=Hyphococcus sp. TaxID=2038636 RepID=UPI003D0B67D4
MRILLLTAALTAPLMAAASAETTTHQGVTEVEVENFIGTVKVETVKSGPVRLDLAKGKDADYPVRVTEKNGVLTIASDEDPDDIRWQDDVDWRKYHDDAFRVFLEDYPTLTLRIPEKTALDFDSAVMIFTADDTHGALSMREGHVDGMIGDIASADIAIHGSGDLDAGNVAGEFKASIYGSGDLSAKSAGAFEAEIHGSGDMTLGDVAGPAVIDINGSGDIKLGNVGAAMALSINGSGDVEAGKVGGGAGIEISGSGDVTLASVSGKTLAHVRGSGDIDIGGGRAEDLMVEISGSGDFTFNGVATNPAVYATRSGSIHIARHEGKIRARGDGDIEISGVDYSDDD